MYASWNGATRLAGWKVLAGDGSGGLSTIARKAKTGFETQIAVRPGYKRFELQALNAAGQVIGTSKPFGPTG